MSCPPNYIVHTCTTDTASTAYRGGLLACCSRERCICEQSKPWKQHHIYSCHEVSSCNECMTNTSILCYHKHDKVFVILQNRDTQPWQENKWTLHLHITYYTGSWNIPVEMPSLGHVLHLLGDGGLATSEWTTCTEHMQWHSAVATKYKISTHTLPCQVNISCHIPGVHGAFNRTTLLTWYSVCPVLDW